MQQKNISTDIVSPVSVLLVLSILLAAIGVKGAWVNLPLAGQIPGLMGDSLSHFAGEVNIFRKVFLLSVFLAVVFSMLKQKALMTYAAVFSVLILTGFFIYEIFLTEIWLLDYMHQSQERAALQSFITKNYWPNLNPDHAVVLKGGYEYLWQRLGIYWSILGIGWKTAFAGAVGVFCYSLIRAGKASANALLFVPVGFLLLLLYLYPLIKADLLHRHGDVLLKSARYVEAVEAYEAALGSDPLLKHSEIFLHKTSRAYYRIYGDRSVLGGLYQLQAAVAGINARRYTKNRLEKINQARLLIDGLDLVDFEKNSLKEAVIDQSRKAYARSWILQGLIEYENGFYTESASSLEKGLAFSKSSVQGRFFLAHVYLKLNRNSEALALLQNVKSSVWSKQLRADIVCTVGDAYSQLSETLMAREAYTLCGDIDEVYNYRAILKMGGT